MFPLAHIYMADRIMAAAPGPFAGDFGEKPDESLDVHWRRLVYVGSILPDFVGGMGLDRNHWHAHGAAFYDFMKRERPKESALALGVWLHGIDGYGFDTYADEAWYSPLGWCFLRCLPYIPQAMAACGLPREYALWKSHNLVELAAELEVAAAYDDLGEKLMLAIHDNSVMQAVIDSLAAFDGGREQNIRRVLQTLDERFSILNVTPEDCAAKYLGQLERRHGITGGSVAALAELISQIRSDLAAEMWPWFDEVERLIIGKFRGF